MQLQVYIPLCLVFLCVVDSRRTEYQRRHPLGYRMFDDLIKRQTDSPDSPPTTEYMPPMPTSEYPDEAESPEDWPYAMFEFTSLVGKCVTTTFMSKRMRMKRPRDGFLSRVCPRILEDAKSLADANETMREKAEELAEENFGFLQCANLLAVRDTVIYIMEKVRPKKTSKAGAPEKRGMDEESKPENKMPGKEEIMGWAKVLFQEADDLFQMCEETFPAIFGSLEKWETEFEKELMPGERYLEQILSNIKRTKPKQG